MSHTILSRVGMAATIGTMLFLPAAAIANPDRIFQAQSYLDNAAFSDLPDYAISGRTYTGSLQTGSSTSRNVRLRAGVEYAFLAACDDYCTDVDLYLYDRSGYELDADSAGDDFPIITFTPEVTGNYRLSITMYSCSDSSCAYAIGSYTR